MSEIALQAVGLVRRIEGAAAHTLVNGIDLTVAKGEFLAITGPSGSGKSSLLYLLGLLDAPTAGEVIVCGQATSKLTDSERADVRLMKCGFVFQFHFLLPEFTALDNVLLPMRAAGQITRISHTANCSAMGDRRIWRRRRGAVALKARLAIWF